MAAIDVSSWGFNGTTDGALRGEPARRVRTRSRSIWLRAGHLLHAASLASAMTHPEVTAMIMVDRVARDRDGR